MKIFFIFLIYSISIFSNDIYIPKTKNEEIILEKYRKQELILGLSNSKFKSEEFNNISLNSIIEEIFKEYLQLNIKTINTSWKETKDKFEREEIDILGYYTSTKERKKHSVFTNTIYNQTLYLASQDDNLINLSNLNNKNIFVLEDSIHMTFFKDYMLKNNIKANLIPFQEDFNNSFDYFLSIDDKLLNFQNKIEIAKLPGVSIGINNRYKDLLPIVNQALAEKYTQKLKEFFQMRKNIIYNTLFYEKLTAEEKIYLKNLKPLKVVFESNLNMGHFSKNYNKYIGSLISSLENISKRTGIQFNIIGDNEMYLDWNQIYRDFLNKKIDIIPLGKTLNRMDFFSFTNQIDNLTVSKINSYQSKTNKIGSIRNSLENDLIEKYYLNDDVIFYENRVDLREALKRNQIKSAFLFSYRDFDMTKYEIEFTEDIPIYLALSKERRMLTNILNKAISTTINREKIKQESDILENYDLFLENKKTQDWYNIITVFSIIFITLFLYLLIKYIYQLKIVDSLKKDYLTGLPSRFEFNEFKITNAHKYGYAILIDINNFKDVNDKYGHFVGDSVIVHIADIIKNTFSIKSAFRISGDEFYIFIEHNNIKKYLEKLNFEFLKSKEANKYNLSLSIGYYHKKDVNTTLENAFKYADMAMYESKKNPELLAVEATSKLIDENERNIEIKTLLRESNTNDIYALFQPKFNIVTNKIVGAEALARWSTKKMGIIYPSEFIPIAESIKNIHLIDYKIAEESIKTMKFWKDNNLINYNFKMSFNLSMATFERSDIVETIISLLEKYSISGEYFEVEITESILSSNLNKTLNKLKILKDFKIQISIDDFTAGYSTASLLPYLPIDVVKFDKSILDMVTKNNIHNHSIYKNLIALVRDLKLKIVAEGIETQYQLEFLKENQVDIGQGFLFSKPILQKDFEALLKKEI